MFENYVNYFIIIHYFHSQVIRTYLIYLIAICLKKNQLFIILIINLSL